MIEMDTFDKKVRERLRKIDKNWKYFTNHYFIEDAPATNNLIENHYSHQPQNTPEKSTKNRQRNKKPHQTFKHQKKSEYSTKPAEQS